jgi:hypothetical protein
VADDEADEMVLADPVQQFASEERAATQILAGDARKRRTCRLSML